MQELSQMIYSYFLLEMHQILRFTWRKTTRRKRVRALYESYDPLMQNAIIEAAFKDGSEQGAFIRDLLFQFDPA